MTDEKRIMVDKTPRRPVKFAIDGKRIKKVVEPEEEKDEETTDVPEGS